VHNPETDTCIAGKETLFTQFKPDPFFRSYFQNIKSNLLSAIGLRIEANNFKKKVAVYTATLF